MPFFQSSKIIQGALFVTPLEDSEKWSTSKMLRLRSSIFWFHARTAARNSFREILFLLSKFSKKCSQLSTPHRIYPVHAESTFSQFPKLLRMLLRAHKVLFAPLKQLSRNLQLKFKMLKILQEKSFRFYSQRVWFLLNLINATPNLQHISYRSPQKPSGSAHSTQTYKATNITHRGCAHMRNRFFGRI